jgi:hypothetical protein
LHARLRIPDGDALAVGTAKNANHAKPQKIEVEARFSQQVKVFGGSTPFHLAYFAVETVGFRLTQENAVAALPLSWVLTKSRRSIGIRVGIPRQDSSNEPKSRDQSRKKERLAANECIDFIRRTIHPPPFAPTLPCFALMVPIKESRIGHRGRLPPIPRDLGSLLHTVTRNIPLLLKTSAVTVATITQKAVAACTAKNVSIPVNNRPR